MWKPGIEVGVLAQHLQWLPLAWRKQPQGLVEGMPGVQPKILGQEAGWGPGGCYMGGNGEVAAAGGGLPGGLRTWGSSRRNLKAARVLEGGYSSLESSNLCGEGSDQSL